MKKKFGDYNLPPTIKYLIANDVKLKSIAIVNRVPFYKDFFLRNIRLYRPNVGVVLSAIQISVIPHKMGRHNI